MNVQPKPTKPFSWSFSALKNFETCERRHQQVDRLKNFKEDESDALKWGHDLHKAMAEALMNKAPLPLTMRHYQSYVDVWQNYARHGVLTTEKKLAFTRGFTPCEYFDNAAWYRGVIDIELLAPPIAVLADWKTGKVLMDSVQLGLSAQMTFAHRPAIEKVVTSYIWLGNDAIDEETYTRDDMPALWNELMPRVKRMEEAYYSGRYDPNPGGLCKHHCPVKDCEYHGRGSY